MNKITYGICGLLLAGALSAQADLTITSGAVINGQDGEARATTNAVDGTWLDSGSSTMVGNIRVGEYATNPRSLARGVVKFAYSTDDLAVGETVTKATLRLYATTENLNTAGAGSSMLLSYSQSVFANTGIVAGDFENATFSAGTTMTGITNGMSVGAWYEFDVTASVLDDLANDGTGAGAGSVFRMQLNDDTSLDPLLGGLDYVTFVDSSDATGGTQGPQLVLETIPEPATMGLVAVFGGAILIIRRRLMI